jgi:hypothetical protein
MTPEQAHPSGHARGQRSRITAGSGPATKSVDQVNQELIAMGLGGNEAEPNGPDAASHALFKR